MMVMTQKSNPCYKCSTREVGCHAKCQKYKEKAAENEARKAAIRKKATIDSICYQMNAESAKKRKRKKNLE